MVTKEHIKICLSCAGDIVDDGFIPHVQEELTRINAQIASPYRIHFELDHWKITASSGAGKPRVQDRLNERIFDDGDIYLGIFWTRHGTPPGKTRSGKDFGSGCEEEFFRAKKRLEGDNIWVFFSDCPRTPSKIDLKQLKQAREFKKEVQEKRIEYIEFDSKDDFSRKLSSHISDWLKRRGSSATAVTGSKSKRSAKPSKKEFQKFNKGF